MTRATVGERQFSHAPMMIGVRSAYCIVGIIPGAAW